MAAIWKGSVAFGLVNIPVELHTAVRADQQLAENLETTFDPERYTDDYRANLMKIIKAKGEKSTAKKATRSKRSTAKKTSRSARKRKSA